jgi:hypothetical protein
MNRYWNPAGAANWNLTSSWSDTDGGATGASVPTIDDDVFFTGTNVNNCTINTSCAMNSLTTSGYTGTITQDGSAIRYFGVKTSITSTGTLKIYGFSTQGRLLILQANAAPSVNVLGSGKLTINVAGIETAYVNFENCIGAGTADWDLTKQATDSSGDCGGNSGITFTTAATQTWTNPAGGSWNDINNWSGRVPLPQDDCNMGIAYNEEATIKSHTVNMGIAGRNIDFTGATWGKSLRHPTGSFIILGSLTLVDGMDALAAVSTITFRNKEPVYLTQNGAKLGSNIQFNSGSKVMLGSNYNMYPAPHSKATTIRNGIFDTNGYTARFGRLTLSGGTIDFGNSTHIVDEYMNSFGSSVVLLGDYTLKFTGLNISDGSLLFNSSSGTSIGGKYNKIWIELTEGQATGVDFFQSNTFNEFKDTTPFAHTLSFAAGTTNTFNKFTVNGSAGNIITIQSGTIAAPSTGVHYLVKNGKEEVECDYLNIQHSVAMPPKDVWFAGENSVNNQADATAGSGWEFRTCQRNWIDLSKFNRRR